MNLDTEATQPVASAPAKQPKLKFATATAALTTIMARDKQLKVLREQDKMVYDAFDRLPPLDPKELAGDGEEWRTNADFGDTEAEMMKKIEQLNNLFTQPFPFISMKFKPDTKPEVMQALDSLANEHYCFIRFHPMFVEEKQNLALNAVATGHGLLHFHTPNSWHFSSVPRCNIIYPKDAKKNLDILPWLALRSEIQINELILKFENEEASTAVGWNMANIRTLISGLKLGTNGGTVASDMNVAADKWVEGLFDNAYSISAANNEFLTGFKMFTREYDGTISEQIIVQSPNKSATGEVEGLLIYTGKQKYKRYTEFLVPFYPSVGSRYLEKIRGYGHRILPHMAVLNDLNCRSIDVTVLSGSLMLKGKSNEDLDAAQRQLRLGSVVTMIPEDLTLDQRGFSNPAAGLISLENNIRARRDANNRVFGGADNTSGNSQITATQAKMSYTDSTRGNGYEADRLYVSSTLFHRALWERLVNIWKNAAEIPPVEGKDEAVEFWEDAKSRHGLTTEMLDQIYAISANTLFGDGDPNQVFLALSDLGPHMNSLPVSSQRDALRMLIAARTRKPELADRWLNIRSISADRELSMQSWRAAQEECSFESSDIPIPVQDDDNNIIHAESHTKYAVGVLDSYQKGVLTPDEAFKRLFRTRIHNDVHLQRLALDKGAEQALAVISKQWQGIVNMMRRMQQQSQEAAAAEQARQLEEIRNPRLSVKDEEEKLTAQARREIMQQESATRQQVMRDEAAARTRALQKESLTQQQLAAINAAKSVETQTSTDLPPEPALP